MTDPVISSARTVLVAVTGGANGPLKLSIAVDIHVPLSGPLSKFLIALPEAVDESLFDVIVDGVAGFFLDAFATKPAAEAAVRAVLMDRCRSKAV